MTAPTGDVSGSFIATWLKEQLDAEPHGRVIPILAQCVRADALDETELLRLLKAIAPQKEQGTQP